jgi:hypothetical protein
LALNVGKVMLSRCSFHRFVCTHCPLYYFVLLDVIDKGKGQSPIFN